MLLVLDDFSAAPLRGRAIARALPRGHPGRHRRPFFARRAMHSTRPLLPDHADQATRRALPAAPPLRGPRASACAASGRRMPRCGSLCLYVCPTAAQPERRERIHALRQPYGCPRTAHALPRPPRCRRGRGANSDRPGRRESGISSVARGAETARVVAAVERSRRAEVAILDGVRHARPAPARTVQIHGWVRGARRWPRSIAGTCRTSRS